MKHFSTINFTIATIMLVGFASGCGRVSGFEKKVLPHISTPPTIVTSASSTESGSDSEAAYESSTMAAANDRAIRAALATAEVDAQGRTILDAQLQAALSDACVPEVEGGAEVKKKITSPDTSVYYFDSEHGIAFSMPYNSEWLGAKFALAPYDLTVGEHGIFSSNQIAFGKPKNGGCYVQRELFLKVRTVAEASAQDRGTDALQSHEKTIGSYVYTEKNTLEFELAAILRDISYTTKHGDYVYEFSVSSNQESEQIARDLEKSVENILRSVVLFDPKNVATFGEQSGDMIEGVDGAGVARNISYHNVELGFTFKVPYNQAPSANSKVVVAPFEVATTTQGLPIIYFGQAHSVCTEGCDSGRAYVVRVRPYRSREEIQKFVENEYAATSTIMVTPNITAVQYYEPTGSCSTLVNEIVGKKYNYVVRKSGCGFVDKLGVTELNKITKGFTVYGK